MQSPHLPMPLYHGTSTLFLNGIVEKGLGGGNPISDWKVLECARELHPLVEQHLSNADELVLKADGFGRMVKQRSAANFNFQHGETYLSPSVFTAVRYAASMRYGSELLTYTLDMLQELLNRNCEGIKDRLFRRFPEVFEKLDVSSAPVLIQVDDVPVHSLLSENGDNPEHVLESLLQIYCDSPHLVEEICQQHNFRLKDSIGKKSLKAWLINVTRWDPYNPEYVLYPLAMSPLKSIKPISNGNRVAILVSQKPNTEVSFDKT